MTWKFNTLTSLFRRAIHLVRGVEGCTEGAGELRIRGCLDLPADGFSENFDHDRVVGDDAAGGDHRAGERRHHGHAR